MTLGSQTSFIEKVIKVFTVKQFWPCDLFYGLASKNWFFSVAENAERGTIIGQIDISDLDQIDRGKLKLELHSTSDKISKHFGIDSAGRIFTTATLDRETESKYTFNILATDSIKPFHTAKVFFNSYGVNFAEFALTITLGLTYNWHSRWERFCTNFQER